MNSVLAQTSSAKTRRIGAKMPTLRDIGDQVGVSAMTVSVVLNGAKPGTIVAEETRRKIEMAAAQLGYKRNGSMVAARTGRFGNVALLLSTNTSSSSLPQRMWDAIHDELAAQNLTVSMARLPDHKLTDAGTIPRVLTEWMADGMLVDYTHHVPPRLMQLIHGHQMPAVWLNSQQAANCVYPADFAAGVEATRHLLKLGHTRIVYADLSHVPEDADEHYSARERREGFEKAMREAGLEPRLILRPDVPDAPWSPGLARLLEQNPQPTALLCYGNFEAELVLMAASHLGWQVPKKLSLMTFGPENLLCVGHAVCSMTVPEEIVGREAVRMLLQKIEAPQRNFDAVVVPFGFQQGQTCRKGEGDIL